eukprot:jgi/Mesvir1/17928/Mv12988-RA.2
MAKKKSKGMKASTIAMAVVGTLLALWIFKKILPYLGLPMWMAIPVCVYLTHSYDGIRKRRIVAAAQARFNMRREMEQSFSQSESCRIEWVNLLLRKLWPLILEQILSDITVEEMELKFAKILGKANKPAFLEDIRCEQASWGTVPPRFNGLATRYSAKDDYLQLELDLDLTTAGFLMIIAAQLRPPGLSRSLQARIEIADLAIVGKLLVGLRLENRAPGITGVDVSFMERPFLNINIRPLGFALSDIPGLAPFLNELIVDVISKEFVEPNRDYTSIERKWLKAKAAKSAGPGGMLTVTVLAARGLIAADAQSGNSDPFVQVKFGHSVLRTRVCRKTLEPTWNQSFDFPVPKLAPRDELDLADATAALPPVEITCLDWDSVGEPDFLGTCRIPMGQPATPPVSTWIPLAYVPSGAIHLSLVFTPPMPPKVVPSKPAVSTVGEKERAALAAEGGSTQGRVVDPGAVGRGVASGGSGPVMTVKSVGFRDTPQGVAGPLGGKSGPAAPGEGADADDSVMSPRLSVGDGSGPAFESLKKRAVEYRAELRLAQQRFTTLCDQLEAVTARERQAKADLEVSAVRHEGEKKTLQAQVADLEAEVDALRHEVAVKEVALDSIKNGGSLASLSSLTAIGVIGLSRTGSLAGPALSRSASAGIRKVGSADQMVPRATGDEQGAFAGGLAGDGGRLVEGEEGGLPRGIAVVRSGITEQEVADNKGGGLSNLATMLQLTELESALHSEREIHAATVAALQAQAQEARTLLAQERAQQEQFRVAALITGAIFMVNERGKGPVPRMLWLDHRSACFLWGSPTLQGLSLSARKSAVDAALAKKKGDGKWGCLHVSLIASVERRNVPLAQLARDSMRAGTAVASSSTGSGLTSPLSSPRSGDGERQRSISMGRGLKDIFSGDQPLSPKKDSVTGVNDTKCFSIVLKAPEPVPGTDVLGEQLGESLDFGMPPTGNGRTRDEWVSSIQAILDAHSLKQVQDFSSLRSKQPSFP